MKTAEQKAAQRARAAARKEKRSGVVTPNEPRASKASTSERHKLVLDMIDDGDGVQTENKDQGWMKWRLVIDQLEYIVEARLRPREVRSIKRLT